MNPLCCIAPVSIDRDRNNNPTVVKPQSQLGFETRNVRPSFGLNNQVSSSSATDVDGSNFEIEENNNVIEVQRDSSKIGSVGGILYKWVNYGKGWRPRWFVLNEDGVLSYYKIHGPDKIDVMNSQRREKGGVKVIGDDSLRYMKRKANVNYRVGAGFANAKQWKPFGEIHLKVCLFICSYSIHI